MLAINSAPPSRLRPRYARARAALTQGLCPSPQEGLTPGYLKTIEVVSAGSKRPRYNPFAEQAGMPMAVTVEVETVVAQAAAVSLFSVS
jgi:hypothetical protein